MVITLRLDTVYICHFTHTPAVPLTPVQSSHVDFILYVVLIVYVIAELTKWSITSAGIGTKKHICVITILKISSTKEKVPTQLV